MAEKCEQAGIEVPLCGTEFIYPNIEATDCWVAPKAFRKALKDRHGTDFGLDAGRLLPDISVLKTPIRELGKS